MNHDEKLEIAIQALEEIAAPSKPTGGVPEGGGLLSPEADLAQQRESLRLVAHNALARMGRR